jgi:cysteine desulfurase
MRERRELLAQRIRRIPGARVLEPGAGSAGVSPSILAVVIPGAPSEVRMHHLEELGVVVSAGSACHAKSGAPSPALAAIGIGGDEAKCMLRFSFSRETTEADASTAADALESVCRKLESSRR